MNRYEFTLKIVINDNARIVSTIVTAASAFQAQQLALAMCGTGEIIFGPYPID